MTGASPRVEDWSDVQPGCGAPEGRTPLRHWYFRLLLVLLLLVPAIARDQSVALWSITESKARTKLLTEFRQASQQFGELMGIGLIVMVLYVLDRPARRPLVLMVSVVALAGGLTSGMKLVIGRERPKVSNGANVFHGPVWPGEMQPDPSFPSGHTTAALALAYCLSRMYPRGRPAFVVLGVLCGVSRVLCAKHFVTDVLVGAWIGWESARLMWEYQLFGLCRFVDRFVPVFRSYPAWNWDRMAPEQ